MATRATGLKTQENARARTGTGFLLIVALATVFALFLGFLNVVRTGGVLAESSGLFGSLVFYAAAAALYLGFGVSGAGRLMKFATVATILGWLCTSLAAGHRWYVSGHPPFASIYEMLLCFVWTVALLTLVAERRFAVKLIGSVTMPLAVVAVVVMQLLPSDVHPLVPALQSTWLHVHVTLAMLAYAACALSFALAMMYLIQDSLKTETFLAATSAFGTAIYALILAARFVPWGGLSVIAYDPVRKEEILLQKGVRLFVVIPDLGWLFLLTLAVLAAPLGIYLAAHFRRQEGPRLGANRAVFLALLLQAISLAVFVWRSRGGAYGSPDADGLFATNLAASPFLLAGLIGAIFVTLLYLMLHWRREDLQRLLPSAEVLDRATYNTIRVAFPLLTLMIAVGAYWANRTWGSYWSWDPKETWAAITWLVYAGYLHMRVTRGWRGRRAAFFAILGFAVVMFTFFGVTYLLPGLHAYA
jgi:ABC-type transport system involved in cytochrome c biogenesis permease subunit